MRKTKELAAKIENIEKRLNELEAIRHLIEHPDGTLLYELGMFGGGYVFCMSNGYEIKRYWIAHCQQKTKSMAQRSGKKIYIQIYNNGEPPSRYVFDGDSLHEYDGEWPMEVVNENTAQ